MSSPGQCFRVCLFIVREVLQAEIALEGGCDAIPVVPCTAPPAVLPTYEMLAS